MKQKFARKLAFVRAFFQYVSRLEWIRFGALAINGVHVVGLGHCSSAKKAGSEALGTAQEHISKRRRGDGECSKSSALTRC